MTEPPATTQLSPIVVPLRINVFAPIQTLLPIVTFDGYVVLLFCISIP